MVTHSCEGCGGELIGLSSVVKNIPLQDNTNGDYMVQCPIIFLSCTELSSVISIPIISLAEQFPHAKDDNSIPKQESNEDQVFLSLNRYPKLVTRPFRAQNAMDMSSLLTTFFGLLFHWH